MSAFQMPDIPDDEVQPMKPDIRWTLVMLGSLLAIGIFSYALLLSFSYFIISNFSLEQEKKFFWEIAILWKEVPFDFSKLSYPVDFDKNIQVSVVENTEINAFASIWWKVIFTTEILKQFKNEEEFLFVLGHEIEHIKNRDPLKIYSFHLPIYLSFLFLWINTWLDMDRIESLSHSYMSRQTELESDIGGIGLVKKYGWNTRCILPFFKEPTRNFEKYFTVSSTHPTNEARIQQIIDKGSPESENMIDCKEWKYESQVLPQT